MILEEIVHAAQTRAPRAEPKMENDQGSERTRLSLSLTEPPLVTSLTGGDVVATFKGRDPDGEDRFARFNLPQDQAVNSLYDVAEKAEKEGSIELEGFWKTRRYQDAERVERTRLEFVITDFSPQREASIQAGAVTTEAKSPAEPAAAAPQSGKDEAAPAGPGRAEGAKQASIALLASRDDLDGAIAQIESGKPGKGASSVASALATYAGAIAQPQFEPAGNGKFKRTGEILSGLPALRALRDDFGAFKDRNIYLDSARAEEIGAKLGSDLPGRASLKDAQALTAERRAENRAAKAPEAPAKAEAAPPAKAKATAKEQPVARKPTAAPAPKATPSAIAHQSDPLILTASAGEIKAATTSKAGLNSAVASTLRTFGAAVSQPEYRAKPGGGFEKTGKVFKGLSGLKMTLDGFGKGSYRNIMLDKAVVTDIMMAMPDTAKSNEAMAAALSASQKRRDEMSAARNAARTKTKQKDRDRD